MEFIFILFFSYKNHHSKKAIVTTRVVVDSEAGTNVILRKVGDYTQVLGHSRMPMHLKAKDLFCPKKVRGDPKGIRAEVPRLFLS